MFSKLNNTQPIFQNFSKEAENKKQCTDSIEINNNNIINKLMQLEMPSFNSDDVYRSVSIYNYSDNNFFDKHCCDDKSVFFVEKKPLIQEQKQMDKLSKTNNVNNKNEAPVWNTFNSMFSQGFECILNANEMLINISQIYDEMVKMEYIDWNEISPFCIEGRIYTMCDDAQFRCEIYTLENSEKNNKSVIVVHKMFGDGWIFEKFRDLLLKRMLDKKCITDNSLTNNDNNESKSSITNNYFNDKIHWNNDDNNNNIDNEIEFTPEKAQNLLLNAIDCTQERDILRENMVILRLAIEDSNKIKIIYNIENIFQYLLQPIIGENQLYDTWMIKTILEIIIKLIQYGSTLEQSQEQQKVLELTLINAMLCNIKQQWANMFQHPLGIFYFYPSQQIVRICDNITLQ